MHAFYYHYVCATPSAPPADEYEDPTSPDFEIPVKSREVKQVKQIKQINQIKQTEISKSNEEKRKSSNSLSNEDNIRIEPSIFYKLFSNIKTNLLLKNLQDRHNDYDDENNDYLLLKGEDRAIIDRRHVFQVLYNEKMKDKYILNYASNNEFLHGLYKRACYSTIHVIDYRLIEIIKSGFEKRKFNNKEKKMITKIIDIVYAKDLKNKLLCFL